MGVEFNNKTILAMIIDEGTDKSIKFEIVQNIFVCLEIKNSFNKASNMKLAEGGCTQCRRTSNGFIELRVIYFIFAQS